MATVIGPEQAAVQNVNNPIFLIVNKFYWFQHCTVTGRSCREEGNKELLTCVGCDAIFSSCWDELRLLEH